MEFVESIQAEGVDFERRPMGDVPGRQDSLVVEVDATGGKNVDTLDLVIPKLSRRYSREFRNLDALDPAALGNPRIALKPFSEAETREIVFKTMIDAELHHTIQLDGAGPVDYRSVVGFFARQLLKELRLVGGYDVLYPKVREFLARHLSEGGPVGLEDPQVLRNLSEPEPGKVVFDSFKKAINALTITDAGTSRIDDRIRLRDTRPFRTEHRPYLVPKKSVFSKIVGEVHGGGFELTFASFLDGAEDVAAFGKNYLAVGFKLDYVRADGDLSNYTPDFLVRTTAGTVYVVETKGREEIDLPQKMKRLKEWCADATVASQAERGPEYRHLFVDQAGFEKHTPRDFAGLVKTFREAQE
jgi:type III restriction enzyme